MIDKEPRYNPKTPRKYQLDTFEKHKNAIIGCLNFACGLGKTFVFTLIALFKRKDTLIIAPKRLCKQWRKELIEEGVDPADIFVVDIPEQTRDPEGYRKRFEAWLAR
jgi:superfamily II DNA or RNA helicase